MAQLALAGAVKLSAHIHTAKSFVEAVNSGNVFGGVMALAQHIPLPSGTGGLGAAFVKADSVDSSLQPISMDNISGKEIEDAVARAKDEGLMTIIHITSDSNDAGSRALVIGDNEQMKNDLDGLPNAPNVAAPWEVEKLLKVVKDFFQLTSSTLSLAGEGLSRGLGATAGALGRLKASIKGVHSAALQEEPKLQDHQRLGNAVLRSQHTYKNQKGDTWSPKSALQLQLRADKISVKGSEYAVLGATADSATIKHVDAQGLVHTYLFTQVEGEPLDNMNSVEIITGVDPKTGKPCIAMSTHAGQDALQAALQNPAFDINNIPDLPPNLKIDVSPFNLSATNAPDKNNEKRDEAIAFQGASLAYYLSLTKVGNSGVTIEENFRKGLEALGDGALLELDEAELVESCEDYAILWNEKTRRAFVLVRGTESGLTSTTLRDFGTYRFDLANSPRGREIRDKVSKFFEANPHMAENVIVSGHSLGGAIAVGIGMDHPTFKVYAFNPGGLPPTFTIELGDYFSAFRFNSDNNPSYKLVIPSAVGPYCITVTVNKDANAWKNINVIQTSGDPISSTYAYAVNKTGGEADIRKIPGIWGMDAHSLKHLGPDQNTINDMNKKYRNRL